MFIAMNTFTINNSRKIEFEDVWTRRERHLKEMPGFFKFILLRGDENDGKRDYISHSSWLNKQDFLRWTESEQFKLAHKNRTPEGIIVGPPKFNSYEVILEE
jgi:heme-degrading monooxygenase HmoA